MSYDTVAYHKQNSHIFAGWNEHQIIEISKSKACRKNWS